MQCRTSYTLPELSKQLENRRRNTLRTTLHIEAVAVLGLLMLITLTVSAKAGVDCRTHKSGSVTITSCSGTYGQRHSSTCRSYRSGSVVKTSCR